MAFFGFYGQPLFYSTNFGLITSFTTTAREGGGFGGGDRTFLGVGVDRRDGDHFHAGDEPSGGNPRR